MPARGRRVANPPQVDNLPHNARMGNVFNRFFWAMGTYAVLAILATVTLDGKMRAAVWILLGGLAVKTLIAYKAPR